MPVEGWLAQLDDNAASTVDVDIASFDPDGFPLLGTGQIRDHVAAVSAYLTVEDSIVRRHIIRYSLYGRELDIIQSHLTKTHCAASCPRPPVGCCNNQHWRIYSMSDIMMTRPSTVAMQLADHIQHMQAGLMKLGVPTVLATSIPMMMAHASAPMPQYFMVL